MLNTILAFFTNVLASLMTNLLSRIHPAIMLVVGITVGAWITYMILQRPEVQKAVGSEATGSAAGDIFADGIEQVAGSLAMAL